MAQASGRPLPDPSIHSVSRDIQNDALRTITLTGFQNSVFKTEGFRIERKEQNPRVQLSGEFIAGSIYSPSIPHLASSICSHGQLRAQGGVRWLVGRCTRTEAEGQLLIQNTVTARLKPDSLQQALANLYGKGPGSTDFRLCRPPGFCPNYSMLPWQL